jgi:hypothetical protein
MNIIDYENTLYNKILKTDTKGFVDKDKLSNFYNNKYKTNIPAGMEYRPDLIARYFLGDEKMAWLITYINDFNNGIKDYTPNREIYIPNY